MTIKLYVNFFLLTVALPLWAQATESIQTSSCLAIQNRQGELNSNTEKFPALGHLCDLVFDIYGSKKDEELALLEKYEKIHEKQRDLEAPTTEEERLAWKRTYDLINLEGTENGLDIAENQTALRHYEALFSVLEQFAWQENFDEKKFWQAWENKRARGAGLLDALNLTKLNLFSFLLEKYKGLDDSLEKERIQKKLEHLKTRKRSHSL